ncbi:MAG: hypothetical protein H0V30_12455 [Chitinophagaceae bacterium]|nr:hypothetical protein [Chitinophagaceae bacterium]
MFIILGLFTACSSSKEMNGVPTQKSVYDGNWTITDITANVPEGIKIFNLFDEAPHTDFLNSIWILQGNGNGHFELKNGNRQDIYWSLFKNDTLTMLQFKKLEAGEKARDIETGYRLEIKEKLSNSFILQMPVPVSTQADGNIRLTFTKT